MVDSTNQFHHSQKGLNIGLNIVAFYLIIMALFNLIGHVLRLSGYLHLNPIHEIYLQNTSSALAFIAMLVMVLNLISGILLFKKLKLGLHVLFFSTIINILTALQIYKAYGVPNHIQIELLVFLYIIRISILIFVYYLCRKKILN